MPGGRVDVLGPAAGPPGPACSAARGAPGAPVYLVGGAVRDALLGLPHGPDVDLVVEGEAGHLARRLADALGGRAVVHRAFEHRDDHDARDRLRPRHRSP